MSTNGNICLKKDGKYYSIYSHWDSYLSHNGLILLQHYKTTKKIWELISLGNISILGSKIGKKHNFKKPPEDTVTAYHRDRNEKWELVRYGVYDTKEELLEHCKQEYTYLFEELPAILLKDEDANGQWLYREGKGELKVLTTEAYKLAMQNYDSKAQRLLTFCADKAYKLAMQNYDSTNYF
jgi:hypothetical protein